MRAAKLKAFRDGKNHGMDGGRFWGRGELTECTAALKTEDHRKEIQDKRVMLFHFPSS